MTTRQSHLKWLGTGLAPTLAAVLLAGCAATEPMLDTAAECTRADWQAGGLADGMEGRNTGYIAVHRDNCAAHGVTPDLNTYEKGYLKGLLEYCTEERGYFEGERGRKYLNACPEEISGAFMEGYARGLTAYRDQKAFRNTQMRENSLGGASEQ